MASLPTRAIAPLRLFGQLIYAQVRRVILTIAATAISVLMTACGGATITMLHTKFTLTINSSNPGSGVQVEMTVDGGTAVQLETTPATVTGTAGTVYELTAPNTEGGNSFSSWSGCTDTSGTGNAVCWVTLDSSTAVTAKY